MSVPEKPASTIPGDDEVDVFFEALAGRNIGPTDASVAGSAGVLRIALLLEQAATLEPLSEAPATSAQQQRSQATLAQLIQEGVFVVAASPATAPKRHGAGLATLLASLRDFFVPRPWPRLAAFSGGLAVVAMLLVVKPWATAPDADDVVRGVRAPVVAVDAPETFARALRADLQALGADAMLVQINANEWVIHADVAPPAALPPVLALLKARGFGDGEKPPFELRVQSKKGKP